ncbi:MAG: NAD-dependent epimerase/dehydratase family protein [Candidatus Paceibacterota bacterium]
MIYVTGGTGYLGGHLVKNLEDIGVKVLSRKELEHPELIRLLEKNNCSVLVNLAAISDVTMSEKDPESAYNVNTFLPNKLIAIANKLEIKHFVQASTLMVYGETPTSGANEFAKANPPNIYSISKHNAEKALLENTKVPLTILRLANLIGPTVDNKIPKGVASVFVSQALANQQIVLSPISTSCNDTPIRDFLDVKDAARAFRLAIENKPVSTQTLNISTGIPTSLLTLANIILSQTKSPKPAQGNPQNTIPVLVGDPSLAALTIKWQHQTDLTRSVHDLIEAHKTIS